MFARKEKDKKHNPSGSNDTVLCLFVHFFVSEHQNCKRYGENEYPAEYPQYGFVSFFRLFLVSKAFLLSSTSFFIEPLLFLILSFTCIAQDRLHRTLALIVDNVCLARV